MRPWRSILVLTLAAVGACVIAGPVAADPVTKVYSSGNLSLPIEDATSGPGYIVVGLTSSTITVPDEGTVIGVKARIRMKHTVGTSGLFDAVSLGGPDRPDGDDGETNAIVSEELGDYGSGATDCSGTPAVLDEAASASIETSSPPFVGSYRPVDPFSTLRGVPLKGDWDLFFLDATPGSGGTLYCWELEITYEPPSTDLALKVKDAPDPVKTGKKLTYTITATNSGPAPASGVVVTDTLPSGAAFVTASSGCARTGRAVRCDVGDLAPAESAKVTVTVKAPKKPGKLVDVATVGADQGDTNPGNNRVTATTRVRRHRS
jgi:uncharacterized repeat protein (TIGR01451 family)